MRFNTALQIFIVGLYIIVLAGLVAYCPVLFPIGWVLIGAVVAGILKKQGRI